MYRCILTGIKRDYIQKRAQPNLLAIYKNRIPWNYLFVKFRASYVKNQATLCFRILMKDFEFL